jgi:hypothetical protein
VQPPQRESPVLGLIFLLREKGKGGGETAWLHGSHIICLSASLFLSASCVLAKERESTNQSVPTTQRCGYVIFNHKAEQSSTAWNVERQQPTTSSNTHSQKDHLVQEVVLSIHAWISFFLFLFFFSDSSYVLYVVVFFKSFWAPVKIYNTIYLGALPLALRSSLYVHYIYGIISFNLRQQGLWTVLDETRAFLLCKPTPTVDKI